MSGGDEMFEAALKVATAIHERIQHNSNIVCPFCLDGDFDLAGLKGHFERGWCEIYNLVETRR